MSGRIAPPSSPRRALVFGIGSVDRGDDAVGVIVADQVREAVTGSEGDWVKVVVHEDPTALLEALDGTDVAVIIDAVRSGAEPGTVTRFDMGRHDPPLAADRGAGVAGTHGLGLAAVIDLARALGRLPSRVVLVGIEADDFGHGRGLSDPVRESVPDALEHVLGVLDLDVSRGATRAVHMPALSRMRSI